MKAFQCDRCATFYAQATPRSMEAIENIGSVYWFEDVSVTFSMHRHAGGHLDLCDDCKSLTVRELVLRLYQEYWPAPVEATP